MEVTLALARQMLALAGIVFLLYWAGKKAGGLLFKRRQDNTPGRAP